jgi:hypothetical protein
MLQVPSSEECSLTESLIGIFKTKQLLFKAAGVLELGLAAICKVNCLWKFETVFCQAKLIKIIQQLMKNKK